MTFRVHILRLFHSEDSGIKYVMRLQPEGVIGPATQFVQYGNDAALRDALNKLNVTEPQQQRALSVLRTATQENFSVDISEDVARRLGWSPSRAAFRTNKDVAIKDVATVHGGACVQSRE